MGWPQKALASLEVILNRFTHGVSSIRAGGGSVLVSESDSGVLAAGSMRTFRTSLTSEPGALLKRWPSPASM